MPRPYLRSAMVVVVLVMMLRVGEAQPLLSNTQYRDLSGSSSSWIPFGEDINLVNAWMAQGFRTGTNENGYRVDAVVLPFDAAIGQPAGMRLELFTANANGLPGGRLGTFSGSMAPVVPGDYRYAAAGLPRLTPNTSYFLVLQSARVPGFGNDEFLWYRSTRATGDSGDGWQVGKLAYQINGGAWTIDSFGDLPGTFEIQGVPEPGVTALLALGVGMCFWRVRKGSRRTG